MERSPAEGPEKARDAAPRTAGTTEPAREPGDAQQPSPAPGPAPRPTPSRAPEPGSPPEPDLDSASDTAPGPTPRPAPRSTPSRAPEPGSPPEPDPEPDPAPDIAPGTAPARAREPAEPVASGRRDDGAGAVDGGGGRGSGGEEGAGEGDRAGEPAGGTRSRRRRWVRRGLLTVGLLVLLPLLASLTALRVNYLGDPDESARTRGRDAIWLGHAWVDGRKKDADVTALAARLKGTGFRDLYVHAGPLEHDGTLPESAYPNARWFIDAVHRRMPGVRVQAWLGDVLAGEGSHGMRLERARTRAAVVRSTREILAAGFEGAHFDLEPLHSDDRDYLTLLDALRSVTAARGALLSVAAHQIDPLPYLHSVRGTLTGHPKWWSQEFFGQVARRVDQIALMSYDTLQPLESTYGGYVAQQTSLALEVTPRTTGLLMGLPFYHEKGFGHWEHAETVAAAVRGVRLGLSRTDADRANFGVAAYVDFAATESDWTSYREGWVR